MNKLIPSDFDASFVRICGCTGERILACWLTEQEEENNKGRV